jgi:hypothetical protein
LAEGLRDLGENAGRVPSSNYSLAFPLTAVENAEKFCAVEICGAVLSVGLAALL